MENEQFAQPDKATFLIVIIFFPLILVGYLCSVVYQACKVKWAMRKARKLVGRNLTEVEKLNVYLFTTLGLPQKYRPED